MKISTEIHSSAEIVGEEKAIEYIAQAGFDAWDFSMFKMGKDDSHPLTGSDYIKFARTLRRIGEDHGIKCNQSHAPFPPGNKGIRSYFAYFERAIECTAEAGGTICVIHPGTQLSVSENAEMYFELLPLAKQYGVKIATENMWDWDWEKNQAAPTNCSTHESFKAHLDAVNDDYFVACVDIGHAEMKGLGTSAAEMIRFLGSKVQALHIHDNDKLHDSHQIPFSMRIEFDPIIKALKDINYDGYFTLEADVFLKHRGYTSDNLLSGIKEMATVARKMSNRFESL